MQINEQSEDDNEEEEQEQEGDEQITGGIIEVEEEDEENQDMEPEDNELGYMDVDMYSNQLTSISMSTNPSPFLLPRDYSEEILQFRPQTQLSDHDATEALLLLSDRQAVRMDVGTKPLTVREMLS